MVDPIITYVFAALFFVALLGSMLYLTFLTPPRDGGEEASVGKSVVGGAGAQERSDEMETGELAATTDSDEVTEERDEEMYDPDEDDGDDSSAEGGRDATAGEAGEGTGDEGTDATAEGDDRTEADDGAGGTDDGSTDEKA